jgi:UDP-2-acetamido-2,6-beta-L-arabino-hexul-4-ose reductase
MSNAGEAKTMVLVTGSDGFMGRNLVELLRRRPSITVLEYDIRKNTDKLSSFLQEADAVFHLAGVNRPQREEQFKEGNADLTAQIVAALKSRADKPLLALSSSIQAALDNPYGKSKLGAEEALEQYGDAGGRDVIFRLSNVFGKWSRPNYNSAVATFCHNIARGLEISVSDPKRTVDLVYIDDVVSAFVGLLDRPWLPGTHRLGVDPVKTISLDELTRLIYAMKDMRTGLLLPDFSDPFVKKLYATYLSFLPTDEFGYRLLKREDRRGSLAELFKSPYIGQVFVSRTRPGFTRGNHYHDTKVEKFCVIEGSAVIRFRHIENSDVIEYRINGEEYRVVDIPPGYTHSIENIGERDCIVLFWASEIFNQDVPDTYQSPVLKN